MKRHSFLILAFFFFSSAIYAQVFSLRGLEQYNQQLISPAYIIPDSKIQIDLIPYSIDYTDAVIANLLISLPRYNSGVASGFRIYNNSQFYSAGINIDYAYRYFFTKDIKLTGGLRVNYSKNSFRNSSFPDFPIIDVRALNTTLASALNYRNLRAGFNIIIPLFNKTFYFISFNGTDTRFDRLPNVYQFVCDYTLGKRDRILINSIMNLRCSDNRINWFLGSKVMVKDIIGLGFTFGDVFSLSTSLKLKNKVQLIFGIYSKEDDKKFSIDFSPVNFICQVRINL